MSLTRIAFPFEVINGRLNLSRDAQAGQEAIEALIRTGTGEMPLSRDYGADLEYNVPLDVAFGAKQRVQDRLAEYHPQLELVAMNPVIAGDGTILDWGCDVTVRV